MSNYIEVSNIYNAGWIMTQGIDPIAVQQNEGTARLTYVLRTRKNYGLQGVSTTTERLLCLMSVIQSALNTGIFLYLV